MSCEMTYFTVILLLFVLVIVSDGKASTKNVGTILFTESDISRNCWSTENIALLTSRMLLEDILPSPEVLDIQDNAFISDIIDYFRLVLEIVRQLTYGKTKHIMLLALTDVLGGYMHTFVLPNAKHSFYQGLIDFDSMDKLYQLYDELKCFLRTNGHGWAKPVSNFCKRIPSEPLPMQPYKLKCDPCKSIVFYKKPCEGGKSGIKIPLPFFDSKANPTAIAVPFKTYSLRNVESKPASYVIVKYYLTAVKCMQYHNTTKKDMKEFNSNLYSWIHNHVIPHFLDEKFYAAFGGVLRVVATLKRVGAKPINSKEMGSYNIMPEAEVITDSSRDHGDGKRKKSNLILMALLATIFIWFLLGSLFICYRIRASKNKCRCDESDSKNSENSKKSCFSQFSSKLALCSSGGDTSKKSSSFSKSSKRGTTSATPSVCSVCCSDVTGGSSSSKARKSKNSLSSSSKSNVAKKPSVTISNKSPSKKKSQPRAGSKSNLKKGPTTMYPAICECQPSVGPGEFLNNSSSEEVISERKQPYVFGYDLDSSGSEISTPRGSTEQRKSNESDLK